MGFFNDDFRNSEKMIEIASQFKSNTIVLFGDSITDACDGLTDLEYFTWANIFLGQRFKILYNAGVSGNTTSQMLARIQQDVLNYKPQYCFLMGGINDCRNNIPSATTISNLKTIYNKLKRAGISIITSTLTPATNFTQAQKILWYEINDWIRRNAQIYNILLVECGRPLIDPTTGNAATGMIYDNTVHPSVPGHFLMGKEIYKSVKDIIKPVEVFSLNNGDPKVINSNPLMLGDVGGLATNWQIASMSTGSATPSKVIRTDGILGEWQKFNVTAAEVIIQCESVTQNVIPNKQVYAQCEISVENITSLKRIRLGLYAYKLDITETGHVFALDHVTAWGDLNQGNWTGVIRTNPLTLSSDTGRVRMFLFFDGVGTFKMGRTEMRYVEGH